MTIYRPCSRYGLLAAVFSIATLLGQVGTDLAAQTAEASRVRYEPSPAGPLQQLKEQYAQIWSVHLRATAEVTIYDEPVEGIHPVLRVGAGSYEYWAQGDKFRLRSQADLSARPFHQGTEEAFDGEFFQMLFISSDVLSLRREHLPITTATLPNPFFAPVAFLKPPSDECPLCTLRLPDLQEKGRWQKALTAFHKARLGRHGMAAQVVGPPLLGTPTIYLPSLREGQRPRVERLVLDRAGEGRCETEFEYSDEGTLESQVVPRVVDSFCQVDTENELAAETDVAAVRRVLEVHQVTFNQAWPDETFRIRRAGREAIVDEDAAEQQGVPLLPVFLPGSSTPPRATSAPIAGPTSTTSRLPHYPAP